jgi:hypothetical protein
LHQGSLRFAQVGRLGIATRRTAVRWLNLGRGR